ncbi:MAG TPA: zinc ribbon domain-containing protein [Candidatus Ratteibacteria bacterium]|nr:zinc ribbon domain-containing protein [Candidatus Ratteibacteria bacterium]
MICVFCKSNIEGDSFFCDQCGKEILICPKCSQPGKGQYCTYDSTLLVTKKYFDSSKKGKIPDEQPAKSPVIPQTDIPKKEIPQTPPIPIRKQSDVYVKTKHKELKQIKPNMVSVNLPERDFRLTEKDIIKFLLNREPKAKDAKVKRIDLIESLGIKMCTQYENEKNKWEIINIFYIKPSWKDYLNHFSRFLEEKMFYQPLVFEKKEDGTLSILPLLNIKEADNWIKENFEKSLQFCEKQGEIIYQEIRIYYLPLTYTKVITRNKLFDIVCVGKSADIAYSLL